MEQQNKVTIEEMNAIIREFMDHGHMAIRLLYHLDWRALMLVVEKIEATQTKEYFGFTVEMRRKHCVILCHEPGKQDGCLYQTPYQFKPDSKIHAALLAVYEFIIWYNKTQNQ